MYVPSHFAQQDSAEVHAFVRRHSFATFVSTAAGGEPVASHLPLLLDDQMGSKGNLIGHMARANPHWHTLEGCPVLAIFTGPHAYISATWYAEPNTVPTWNYTAVHVYGICRLVHEKAEIIRMLQDCVNFYEGSMQEPWRFNSETDFAERLAAQVVGFRIEISRWEAKWKLGQNHPSSRRRRAIAALDRQPNNGAHEIAALMRTTLIEEDNPDVRPE